MNRKLYLPAGGIAAALVAALIVISQPLPVSRAQSAAPTWQAVKAEVPVGKGVRIEVRLVGIEPPPAVADISVKSSRIDMGPDGMATMAAPLKPVSASAPGVLAFETDLIMAGRWALTLSAQVTGRSDPISGEVIFTAVEKKSEATPARQRKILYYRHPMGLPDVSPTPKKDSMGMDYIPVYEDEAAGPAGTVRVSLEKMQRAGVRTEPAARRTLTRTIRGFATIVPDESRVAVTTAKFSGFVEELFVPVTGAVVRAGQPLMRIWIESPEILQKQADFTTALSGRSPAAIETTERNLRLFGLPKEAIAEIRRNGRPTRSITLMAPKNGTVMEKPSVNGMRFAIGDTLFRTADLSSVWAMAQVAERDLGLIVVGQKARITVKAFPDRPIEGTVAFVYPALNAATRTALVRIELANPDGALKTEQYADVTIEAQAAPEPVLAIPDSAVIDNGARRVAFVAKGEGTFEPRNLTLGARGGDFVEVREGIAEGDEIVVRGNFLIDAESNLKAALAAFTAPETAK